MAKKIKKVLCTILVCTLVFSIAACGKKDSSADNSNAETKGVKTEPATTAKEENPLDKFYEISWVAGKCGDIEEDNYCQKWLEEKMNIKIKTKKIDINNSQQVDLMLASGEMPDCGWIHSKSAQELYDQKLTRTIPKSMIEKYAPEYTKLVNDNPMGWKLTQASGKTDEHVMLSGYHAGFVDSLAWISVYRLDWLENIGIKPNGKMEQIDQDGRVFLATEPFTQDQFTSIMEAFTKNDPDKNGKDDTYGMGACNNKTLAWLPFMGMFGIQPDASVEENGKSVEHYVSNAYRDFLKYANDLYKKGFIDKEFPTLNHVKMWEKVEAGKAGYSATSVGYTNASLEGYKHRPPRCMLLQNPDAKVLVVPPEIGSNGKGGTKPLAFSNFSYQFVVNKKVDDDKLAKILQMFDYINFDKEAKFFLRYGKEGEHFTWSGTPNDSTPVFNEGIGGSGGKYGFFSYNANNIAEIDMKKLLEDPQNRKVGDYSRGEWKKYLWYPTRYDLLKVTKYDEYNKQSGNAINTLVNEFFFKAITGEVDIDKEWDKYIKQLKDAGYDKLEEELNKAPLFSEILKGNF